MEHSDAIDMLRHPALDNNKPGAWADLGSGSGVFTSALASILPAGSSIVAVDTDEKALQKVRNSHEILITTMLADFTEVLSLPKLEGILMANSIHYVQNKELLLRRLKAYLQTGGWLLLVEYDTERSNPWVPYPLSFAAAASLLTASGFTAPEKVHERRSVYNEGHMYSCIAQLLRH